ncbi:hypothetical protein DFH08DRAFT_432889 [Mycena albidolilacea]|uniref:DUF7330 domain-containing protein n=1 Tax=Mycena albidolilacea TaxID=1033008 RepID=A0AAD6ZAX5_9AGAR|nr:hypothetical protein DFH08DRAFT_432889 [Mycena albidolilacea]
MAHTHSDLKDRYPNSLPTPVQMSGPPPYGAVPSGQTMPSSPSAEWSARPQNHIHISRTCGAVNRSQFVVDPNVHVPASLLTPPTWDPGYISLYSLRRPKPNLDLGITFGGIDADIKVLPVSGHCTAQPPSRTRLLDEGCPRQSTLDASTTTGNVSLHIDAQHFSVRASSTFGQIRVFLPRTFNGPLTITSSLGAPSLSPELKRACTPISEMGNSRRWFVGDFGAWEGRSEHGDEALVGTSWGRVWVGYAGEEEEAKRAFRWDTVQFGVNLMLALVMLFGVHLAVKLLFWILALIGITF